MRRTALPRSRRWHGRDGRRAVAVQGRRRRCRRRDAADLAVHRDLGHLRQRRRTRAERPRRRQAAGRRAAGVEGASRARQPARPRRLRVRDAGRGARRGARQRRRRSPARPAQPAGADRRRRQRQRRPRPAGSSASPTCRSTRPTASCAARLRCSSPPTRVRRSSACRATVAALGLAPGAAVRVTQGSAEAVLPAAIDATLAAKAVRIAAGHRTTAALGAMFGLIASRRPLRAGRPTTSRRRRQRHGLKRRSDVDPSTRSAPPCSAAPGRRSGPASRSSRSSCR